MSNIELFRLFGSILIDDKDAINSLKNVDNKGKEAKSSLASIADKGAKIGAVIAGAGAVAGGALYAMTNKITDTTGAIKDAADRAGFSAEEYQKWAFAAEQSGMSAEQLEKAMIKQQKAFADAKTGSETMGAAYKALGIDISNISNSSDAFDIVMKKLGDMKDVTERDAIANDIFGKSYAQLTPLLNEGGAGMDALKQKAVDLGGVMSNEAVANGEQLGDTLDQIKLASGGLFNSIATGLLPTIQNFANWVVSNMPTIQSTAGSVFDKLGSAIQFIASNSNILIPILVGVAGAFVAMQVIGVINGLMTAYTAFTTTATGTTMSLNAALLANPIGLVIAAIATLIAIGVALYMNWDKVSEVCSSAFGKVQEVVSGAVERVKGFLNGVINFIQNNWQGLLLLIVNPFAGAFKLAYDNCEGFRTKVDSIFNKIKSGISTAVNGIKTVITTVFSTVKDIMTNPFETARDIIKTVIDKIKGFLNFNWEFPKLKMPHFSVSGSMNPLKWLEEGAPTISVDWYAKGAIFDEPTIFNTPYGLKGVGEAGPEVVAPLSSLKEMLGLNKQENSIVLQFYPQKMTDEELDRTFEYVNHRFGMEL